MCSRQNDGIGKHQELGFDMEPELCMRYRTNMLGNYLQRHQTYNRPRPSLRGSGSLLCVRAGGTGQRQRLLRSQCKRIGL